VIVYFECLLVALTLWNLCSRLLPMRYFLPLLAVCVLAPCLGTSAALAEPPTAAEVAAKRDPRARAAELVQRGTELHAQGECEQAVATLEGAWAIEKSATTATLLGECEVKLTRWVAAAEHLGFVLRDLQEGPERARLQPLFSQARAQVGGVRIQTSVDGADVFAGARIVGRTPIRDEVFVEPGEVTISIKKTSVAEMQQVVRVAKGSSATVHLEPERIADVDAGADNEAPSRVPVYVLAGVALAAAGTGIALRVVSSQQGSSADDGLAALTKKTSTSPCLVAANATACQTIKDQRTKHDTFANASTGLFVLGGAALAASITYALWPSKSARADRAVSVVPAVSPSAGGLLVQGAF
jgi:hypothetical protein